MKICLVCSSGGHLSELFYLKEVWENMIYFWVSFPTKDAQYILKSQKCYWANFPTNRNIVNMIKNLGFAWKILRKEKPGVIISTGAGVAVPFIVVGKMLRIKSVYIESITRSRGLSLTGYLVYPFVNKFLVQWPELEKKYKKAEFHGQVI